MKKILKYIEAVEKRLLFIVSYTMFSVSVKEMWETRDRNGVLEQEGHRAGAKEW